MKYSALLSTRGLIIAGFIFFGFAVFGTVLNNEFVSWDDALLIVDNDNITAINSTTLRNVFTTYDPELYIPLTFISYQIDYAISEYNPAVYHATNLFLHIANSLLICWALSLLFGFGWLPIALSLLFLIHPINAEAVGWASARKDVLSTFFFLGSLISYIEFRSEKKYVLFSVSLALFLLGLLSKVVVITLPVILLFLDFLSERKDYKTLIMEKIPYVLLSVIFGIVALFGKTAVLAASTPWQKVLMAAKSSVFYIQKFLVPTGLSFAYPYTKTITILRPDFLIPLIVVVGVLSASWFVRRRYPLITFGAAFYLVTLTPTFINFSKGSDNYFASDRYAYIPLIGLLIVLGSLVQLWLDSSKTDRIASKRLKAVGLAFALVIGTFSLLAHFQAQTWKNSEALYTHALKYYPNARAAYNNLGMELLTAGHPAAAIEQFDKAASVKDDSKTRVNRAAALAALNRYDEAIKEYNLVIDTYPSEPDAYYGLGNMAYKKGDLSKSIEYYRLAIEKNPKYVNAINNLGAIYVETGDWDNAITTLKQSIEIQPRFPESHYNLAGALQRSGRITEAEESFRKAIDLSPGNADAYAALATLLYDARRIPEAAETLKSAFALQQENTMALSLLSRMEKDGIVK